ncbi:MAG: DUF3450 family protein [Verrucomicrobiota bacterium JB022]|nr:DUF3450 family protein [Verrucomicrobiota bacterium JB022]
MKKTTRFGLCAVALCATSLAAQQNTAAVKQEIDSTRNSISEYVRVRQDIAKARNEWQAEKEIIQRRIDLFEQEKADLQERIATAQERASSAQQVISEKRSQISQLTSATNVVRDKLPDYEAQIAAMIDYLPAPLKRDVEKLTPSLGKGPVSNRMAVVIGILNQIERFNSQFIITTDLKQTADGQSKSVDVLYLGLAQAYYVDQEGTIAGIGTPAKGGWQWTERNDLAPQIQKAFIYYRGDVKPAEFVELPINVTDVRPSR